jgi:Leucine-rich repeat (LRR) protein
MTPKESARALCSFGNWNRVIMPPLTLWLCMVLLIVAGTASDVPFVFDETTSSVAGYSASQIEQAHIASSDLTGVPAVTQVADNEVLDFPITGGGNLPERSIKKNVSELRKSLDAAVEPDNPRVHEEAVVLALKYPGDLTIDQIDSIYSYLKNGDDAKKGWGYVRDPRGLDYFNYANASLRFGDRANCVGGGDCDDFAIVMAALVESIGGTTRIVLARNNTTGGHAYTEVYLGQLNATGSQVETIINWLKQTYETDKIYTHIDTATKDVWLNLDWGKDEKGNVHPGGPFFQGDKHIVLCLRDEYGKTQLKVPENSKTVAVKDGNSEAVIPSTQITETPKVNQLSSEGVVFPDSNLEAAIRAAIDKPTGIIYAADLEKIVSLTANNSNIKNIKGLEYCTNLGRLDLYDNQITDVKPLAGLTNLQKLRMEGNQIADVKPLAGLTNLQWLGLGDNQITDVKPLVSLTNLQWLELSGNQITDIKPLAGLTNLQWLGLGDNQITDVEPLAGLTTCFLLSLFGNQITDVKPLAGLTNLQWLYLSGNQITDVEPLAGLTNLQVLYLNSNQITDVEPLAGLTNLQWLGLGGNQITDVKPLAGLTNLQWLDLDGKYLNGGTHELGN